MGYFANNVGSDNNGLAIALEDVSDTEMNLDAAYLELDNLNTDPLFKVTSATWSLPSQDQWKAMFKAFGGSDSSYTGLNNALVAAGDGEDYFVLQENNYWSSTKDDGEVLYMILSKDNVYWSTTDEFDDLRLRACIAF